MTPSKIADPLLPELDLADARKRLPWLLTWLEGDSFAPYQNLATWLPQLLSAAERGIAAGEEVQRAKQQAQACASLTADARIERDEQRRRAAKAEADLAASNARIGEARNKALEEAIVAIRVAADPAASRFVLEGPRGIWIRAVAAVSALLTPTHPETER